jgi:hypothetical protein
MRQGGKARRGRLEKFGAEYGTWTIAGLELETKRLGVQFNYTCWAIIIRNISKPHAAKKDNNGSASHMDVQGEVL